MQVKYVMMLCVSLAILPFATMSHAYYDDRDGYEYSDDGGFDDSYYYSDDKYNNDSYYNARYSNEKYRDDGDDNYDDYNSAFSTDNERSHKSANNSGTSSPLPQRIKSSGEKFIFVDPREHAWGAYDAKGILVRWGLATAGANWCSDIDKACRTRSGSFRIFSLGDETCYSRKFPVPDGGAPMPYCMYFNGGQALHGSDEVVYGNESHGCVRMHVSDARWLRYHFVQAPNSSNHYRGTLVVIRPYS